MKTLEHWHLNGKMIFDKNWYVNIFNYFTDLDIDNQTPFRGADTEDLFAKKIKLILAQRIECRCRGLNRITK